MEKETEEYMILVDFKNTEQWEDLLSVEVPLEEALEYYKSEIQSSYDVKVVSGGEDVTNYFDELLWMEADDYSDEGYEDDISSYDFQYQEAKAAGHFS